MPVEVMSGGSFFGLLMKPCRVEAWSCYRECHASLAHVLGSGGSSADRDWDWVLNDFLLLRRRGRFCADLHTVPWRRCFGSALALFNSLSVCFLRRMWKLAHTVIPMLSFSRQLSKYVLILSRSADRVVSMGGTLCLLS